MAGSSTRVERCQICGASDLSSQLFLGYMPPANTLRTIGAGPFVPAPYPPGALDQGKDTKITNLGGFVEREDDLEGLLHISELADHKVEKPQDVVQQDQQVEVKILRVDLEDRKIGLSLKRAAWTSDQDAAAERQDKKAGGGQPQSNDSGLGGLGHGRALGTDKITFGPSGAN